MLGTCFPAKGIFSVRSSKWRRERISLTLVGDMDEGKRAALRRDHVPQLNQHEHTEVVHISHFSEVYGKRVWSLAVKERPKVTQHRCSIRGIHPAREVKDQSSFGVV